MNGRVVCLLAGLVLMIPMFALAHSDQGEARLPAIGPAAGFALTDQSGAQVTLELLRGKVVAVTFGYTACPDICPLLTEKMVRVQDALGDDFGTRFKFVFITVDPAHDTPEVLKDYARAWNANLGGWFFLTGPPAKIADLARRYGVVAKTMPDGSVEHTQLTSLIDASGIVRVQYLGYRFNQDEFRRDLLSLAQER